MGTRSIIGQATDSGFEGRYCHWDGYPTCRGQQIMDSYNELGGDLDKLIAYAIRPGVEGYWSSYAPPSEEQRDGDTWRSDNGDSWATQDDDWGAEWAYLLSERGIDVLENNYREDKWERAGFVPWSETSPDWEGIESGKHAEA